MKIVILEPHLEQSVSLAKFLKKFSNKKVTGLLSGQSRYFPGYKVYDQLINNFEIDDLVVPTGAESTFKFLNQQSSIKIGEVLFDQSNLKANDKTFMLRLAEELNIPIPHTYNSPNDVKDFPVFYKDKFEHGRSQRKRGIAYNRNDIPINSENLILQEYIDSPYTFGAGFISENGKIKTFQLHKEIFSIPAEGGSGVLVEDFFDNRLLELTENILGKMNYSGWGLAEFKFCHKRNDFVFMELNAKFWASIEFAFYNNPVFLKNLFGIDYQAEKIERMFFLRRFTHLPFKQQIKILPHIYKSKITETENVSAALINNLLPDSFKKKIKRILK